METIKLRTHIGADGILRLETPVGGVNRDVEVIVVMSAMHHDRDRADWLDFLDRTAGSLADDPIERPPQAKWTEREEPE